MHRRKRKKKGLLAGMIVFAALAIGFYVLAVVGTGDGGSIPTNTGSANTGTDPQRLDAVEPSSAHPPGFPLFTAEVHTSELTDTQYLKLVNREHALAAPVSDARLVTVWPDMPARTNYVTLHTTAFSAMRELFTAAQNANIGSLFIASGYRSNDEQSQIYANAVDSRYVMPPGHSEHQLGIAADILTSAHDFQSIRGTPEAEWLAENAPQFGLILRYPYDKQDITEVAYEPWHFRYVGQVHAWYMGLRNFVLEEYIAYLGEQGGYQAEFDGRTYSVLYQRPENGMIFVPEGLNFWVSSANTGGYIVTAWR